MRGFLNRAYAASIMAAFLVLCVFSSSVVLAEGISTEDPDRGEVVEPFFDIYDLSLDQGNRRAAKLIEIRDGIILVVSPYYLIPSPHEFWKIMIDLCSVVDNECKKNGGDARGCETGISLGNYYFRANCHGDNMSQTQRRAYLNAVRTAASERGVELP